MPTMDVMTRHRFQVLTRHYPRQDMNNFYGQAPFSSQPERSSPMTHLAREEQRIDVSGSRTNQPRGGIGTCRGQNYRNYLANNTSDRHVYQVPHAAQVFQGHAQVSEASYSRLNQSSRCQPASEHVYEQPYTHNARLDQHVRPDVVGAVEACREHHRNSAVPSGAYTDTLLKGQLTIGTSTASFRNERVNRLPVRINSASNHKIPTFMAPDIPKSMTKSIQFSSPSPYNPMPNEYVAPHTNTEIIVSEVDVVVNKSIPNTGTTFQNQDNTDKTSVQDSSANQKVDWKGMYCNLFPDTSSKDTIFCEDSTSSGIFSSDDHCRTLSDEHTPHLTSHHTPHTDGYQPLQHTSQQYDVTDHSRYESGRFGQRNSSSDVYDLSSFQTHPVYQRNVPETNSQGSHPSSSTQYHPNPVNPTDYKPDPCQQPQHPPTDHPQPLTYDIINTAPSQKMTPSPCLPRNSTPSRCSTPQSVRQLPSYEKATRQCRTPPPYGQRNQRASMAEGSASSEQGQGCYNVRLARRVPTPHQFDAPAPIDAPSQECGAVDPTRVAPPIRPSEGVGFVGATSASISNTARRARDSRVLNRRHSSDEDSGCGQAPCTADLPRKSTLTSDSMSPAATRQGQTTTTTTTTVVASVHALPSSHDACPRVITPTANNHRSPSSSSSCSSESEVYVSLKDRCKAPLRSRTARDMNSAFTRPASRCATPISTPIAPPIATPISTHSHLAAPQVQANRPPARCPSTTAPQLAPLALKQVLRRLGASDLCRAASTCIQWWSAAWDPSLWRHIRLDGTQLPNKNEYGEVNVDGALKSILKRLSGPTGPVCLAVESVQLTGGAVVSDSALRTLAKRCPELRTLHVATSQQISNIGLFELVSACVNLTDLDVSDCPQISCIQLTPDATIHASAYGQRSNIRKLDMSGCQRLDDAGVRMVASFCPQLECLYMRRCTQLTDTGLQYISNYCKQLQEISVNDCSQITSFGIAQLSTLGTSLRYLSIAKCSLVDDQGVIRMASSCTRLRYLNLRACESLTDQAFVKGVGLNCPSLKSLDIGKCNISDTSLRCIANKCPKLRKLSLKGCRSIGDCGVITLAGRLGRLQRLNLQECNLQVDAYKAIKLGCRNCVVEHTNPAFF